MKNHTYDSYRMFLKTLSNRTCFQIILCLKEKSNYVNEICECTGFEQSRVSHNLRMLEECGFVLSKRKGKNKVYYLNKKYIIPILKNIEKHILKYEFEKGKCSNK